MTALSTDRVRTSAAERDELRAAVRSYLAERSDEQVVRRTIDAGVYDPAVWSGLATELGVVSLALPAAYGGDGYSFAELHVVFEELGRALTPSPFLATVVLAASALLASEDDVACAEHLPAIAAGTRTATLAVSENWSPDGIGVAAADSSGWTLTGAHGLVLDGATADLLLVVATTPDGPSLFAVPATAPGLTRTPLAVLDGTRPLARVEFAHVPARLVGSVGGATDVVDRVVDLATTALAAEQVGGARACLEASASYARERVQFGRAIGSFQAVKHKCADMFTRVQLADAAATEAANVAADGAAALRTAAAVAHIVCSEAYLFAAAENIQVHGGIGFTWEHPAHLYYRRATASQLLFGGPGVYYERLLRATGV
ncbi:acyl-CoA dehydrogenase family protein [Cryptosporangium aurantiacum]|uniref:Acyl-CoA dehydrogenase n=1 Tax=Cryptosporangium aurantiacum TaxID=134849 RepID=A0A1M7PN99_9ACTN|nr:acyl-CoA dehydrogenase family protein [Cryptosporangium aurantiacum]SHN18680.1 Acyl-CoA dehydrogenase [Cryptosporangium aurantiacum]